MRSHHYLFAFVSLCLIPLGAHAQERPDDEAEQLCEEGAEGCEALPSDADELENPLPDPGEITEPQVRLTGFHPRCGGLTPPMVADPQAAYQRQRFQELCRRAEHNDGGAR